MDMIIDLLNEARQPFNIETSWAVKIIKDFYEGSKKWPKMVSKFLRKHQHIEKTIKVAIENIHIDDSIIFDADHLFTIVCTQSGKDGETVYQQIDLPIELKLERMTMPFSVFFNSAAVKDCIETQTEEKKVYKVTFDIVLKDPKKNDEVIYVKSGEVNIQFAPQDNKPEIKIFLQPENGELQYSAIGNPLHQVGTLVVKLPNPLRYAPSVDLKIEMNAHDSNGQLIDGLLVVKDAVSNESIDDEIIMNQKRTKLNGNNKAVALSNYTLWFDLSKIPNPMCDIKDYTISPKVYYKYSYQTIMQPMVVMPKPIRVLKDKQGTELVVDVLRQWKTEEEDSIEKRPIATNLTNNSSISVPKQSFTSKSMSIPIIVKLSNKATDTSRKGAGLKISGLKLSTVCQNSTTILNSKNEALSFNNLISFRDEDDLMRGNGNHFIFIPNGKNKFSEFQLVFHPKGIYRIFNSAGKQHYSLLLTSKLEFDYVEDANGDGRTDKKHFNLFIEWELSQDPNPEWLGVDYGSSAIVCYYGSGNSGGVINLRETRKKVFNTTDFSKDEKDMKDEEDTPFLPSDILFNDVKQSGFSSLCSQIESENAPSYRDMSVMLAPTQNLIISNFRRQLPCLKILMGNEFLPDNVDYNGYDYNCFDENGVVCRVKAADRKEKKDSLLRIESIFNEAYHTLFRYFIQDNKITELTNQIVLTYPNTYTPRNLNTLKSIIEKLLPNERIIRFVSESDAVAAYYMNHWSDYHSDDTKIEDDENILVYDMGAGTLDVTFLTKRYNQEDRQYTLEICGKIGTGRAGNYIDYIIAQILGKILSGAGFKKLWIETSLKGVRQEDMEARVELKSKIKTEIKPSLSKSGTDIQFRIADKDFSLNSNDILNHPLFKQFLEECTRGILSKLTDYIGDGTMSVDTVIMSGRSLKMVPLQKELKKLFGHANCIMLDNVVKGQDKGKVLDRSKTAVIEGAKTYVEIYMNPNSPVVIKSRRLNASYGVAYKRTGGQWIYKELLNRNNIPFTSDCSDSFTRLNGPLTIEGTNESDILLFIQSYLSEEATRKALNDHKVEFIQKMGEVMMSTLGHRPRLVVDASVDRYNNVSLMINGQITEGKTPKGVDLNDIITKQSLWPISIEG